MAANGGRHQLGPESGRLTLRTYRSGLAAQAGHDLTIDVIRWHADIDPAPRNFTADGPADPNGDGTPRALDASSDLTSLAIREGRGGLMPLTDRDRRDILGQARKALDTGHYPDASYCATTFAPDPSGGLFGALKLRDEVEVEITVTLPRPS